MCVNTCQSRNVRARVQTAGLLIFSQRALETARDALFMEDRDAFVARTRAKHRRKLDAKLSDVHHRLAVLEKKRAGRRAAIQARIETVRSKMAAEEVGWRRDASEAEIEVWHAHAVPMM